MVLSNEKTQDEVWTCKVEEEWRIKLSVRRIQAFLGFGGSIALFFIE